MSEILTVVFCVFAGFIGGWFSRMMHEPRSRWDTRTRRRVSKWT